MKTKTGWQPTPAEIGVAPELSFLALLDLALATTVQTLLAAHPELDETSPVYQWSPTDEDIRLADNIRYAAEMVRRTIYDYRQHMAILVRSTWVGGTEDRRAQAR